MQLKNPGCSDMRQCAQADVRLTTADEAMTEKSYVTIFVAVVWGVFFFEPNEGISLKNFASNFEAYKPIILLVFIFTVILVVSAFAGTSHGLRIAEELRADGITVPGVVVDKWTESHENGESYYVAYQVNYMDNIWIGKTSFDILTPSQYDRLQAGDSVDIFFLPRDPAISIMKVD